VIRLRPVAEGDRARLLAWRNRPDVRRWMYTDHVIGVDEHDRWFTGMLADPTVRYWVIERRTVAGAGGSAGGSADGSAGGSAGGSGPWAGVGVVNLVGLVAGAAACAFGIYLGEPVERGSGVGRAALVLAVDAAFALPGIDTVTAQALATNSAALAAYDGLGMQRVRVLPGFARKDGVDVDVVEVAIGRAAWEHRRVTVAGELRERGLIG
jgi:UDP-4-amino-4,6-dideoxy-N-acetyl-beta-L-altrosamine N-acetyltransferase